MARLLIFSRLSENRSGWFFFIIFALPLMKQVKEHNNTGWDQILRPKTSWFDLRLHEIIRYRDLLWFLVKRDITTVYKQTVLGIFWYFIPPILTTLMFNLVFGNIAGISTDGSPRMLFYMSGVVAWSYFSECIHRTSVTFIGNAAIFGKVYFPRLIMPLSVVVSSLVKFGVQFLMLLCFLAYFLLNGSAVHPNIYILYTPLLLVMMGLLGLGLGIIISSLTTKYRDLSFLVSFGVTLLMYATPVIYPLSSIPSRFKLIIELNPMTSIIETFRYAYLGSGNFDAGNLLYTAIFTAATLVIGALLFNRVEKTFMDTV